MVHIIGICNLCTTLNTIFVLKFMHPKNHYRIDIIKNSSDGKFIVNMTANRCCIVITTHGGRIRYSRHHSSVKRLFDVEVK